LQTQARFSSPSPLANGTSSIQLLASGTASFQPVGVLGKFGGMAFLPGADTALLADASANTVVEASHLTGTITLTPLAAAADGVSQPMAVAISADGQLAAVAKQLDPACFVSICRANRLR
jgi:hypothetical protein